ncbi:MAG: glycosyltransferase family 4 protein [Steroidobacteraceae bacterium]|nr:glycosyltransferase family 4 protein [Steroidobacteraceae bacterium]
MRVLHLIESGGYFGAEVVIRQLAREQHRRGYVVEVAALRPPGTGEPELLRRCREDGVATRQVTQRHRFDVGKVHETVAEACASGVQVVHSHGYKANICAALLPVRHAVARVATLHGWTGFRPTRRVWWYETLERTLLGRMDVVACVHSSLQERLVGKHENRARVRVIPNGVPVPERAAAVAAHPGLDSGVVPVVGFVGRLAAGKGVDTLLDAVARLRGDGQCVRTILVGEGPRRAALEARVRELALVDDVEFAGYVKDAQSAMQGFDVLVLPSHSEGMPMVVLEALAVGVPVVASDVGGCRDALDAGRLGVLMAPGSVDDCADGIRRALGDETLRAEVRRSAPAWVQARFGVERMADLYEAAYADALERREVPPELRRVGAR